MTKLVLLRTKMRLVGPSSWEPATQVPAWMQDRPQLKEQIVLVTTSTEYQGDDRLLQVALDALAQEPVTVIAISPARRSVGVVCHRTLGSRPSFHTGPSS
jgi:UDP:flavonoid glycosyltransferase YjiC (YdhE family)